MIDDALEPSPGVSRRIIPTRCDLEVEARLDNRKQNRHLLTPVRGRVFVRIIATNKVVVERPGTDRGLPCVGHV